MTDTAWKRREREVCTALGGTRRGPPGNQPGSDCVNTAWAVEVTKTKNGTPTKKKIDQARAHSTRDQLPWMLVVFANSRPDPTATLQFKEVLRMLGTIEELRNEVAALSCAEGEETEEAGEPTGGVAATLPFPLGGARRQPGGL